MMLFSVIAALLPFSLAMPIDGADTLSPERRDLHAWLEVAKEGDVFRSNGNVYELTTPHNATLAKRQGTGSCPNAEYR